MDTCNDCIVYNVHNLVSICYFELVAVLLNTGVCSEVWCPIPKISNVGFGFVGVEECRALLTVGL